MPSVRITRPLHTEPRSHDHTTRKARIQPHHAPHEVPNVPQPRQGSPSRASDPPSGLGSTPWPASTR